MIGANDDFLYHQVADELAEGVASGVFKTGDRLPSVRTLSRERGVSLSTAFKAYSALESKGLIEARPKSGYYVRFRVQRPPAPHRTLRHAAPPESLSVDEMIAAVYANLTEAGVVQLSLAAPGYELLPAAKLNKCLLEALRSSPTNCLHYEHIAGSEDMRRQLARLALNWGGNYTADDVIVTHGCMEALSFCLQTVTKPGDTVAIERPTYFGIFSLLKNLGLRALEVPTDPH
ncbi:MAG: PLP-dependent aminotransferase family protein, partial [Saprospiraceae bacterium]